MYLDDDAKRLLYDDYQPNLIIRVNGSLTETKQEIMDELKKGLLDTAKKTNAIILSNGNLPFIDESFENIPCLGFVDYEKT